LALRLDVLLNRVFMKQLCARVWEPLCALKLALFHSQPLALCAVPIVIWRWLGGLERLGGSALFFAGAHGACSVRLG
jgi:hypothetical protein